MITTNMIQAFKNRAFIFSMILPPFALVPLIIIFRNNSKFLWGFVIALIGIESTTVLLLFLLEVKKRIKVFALASIPILSLCFWVFVNIPFFVILPGALIIWGNTDAGLVKIISTGTAFLWFLTMGAVTVFSIVLNEVFKRIEYEKRAKFWTTYMKAELDDIHVKSEIMLLRIIYDQNQLNKKSEQDIRTDLLGGNFVYFWEIDKDDPKDLKYSKRLIYEQMLTKLNKLREKTEEAQRKKEEMKLNKQIRKDLDKRKQEEDDKKYEITKWWFCIKCKKRKKTPQNELAKLLDEERKKRK